MNDDTFAGTKVLVVDDDYRNILALTTLLERGHAEVTVAQSGSEALAAIGNAPDTDIVLMDIMMPVMDGYETMRAIRALDQFKDLPIVAVTGRVMAGERERCMAAGADDYVPKPVNTAELITVLGPWLRRATVNGSPSLNDAAPSVTVGLNQETADPDSDSGSYRVGDDTFAGTKVLVVDDDFRNIFAMTALLERGHAEVTVAESGADALVALAQSPDFTVVLMDIMMPVMDGYETMRAIRAIDQYKDLPIIAVTGKETSGERERCLAAGANDYVPKPVNPAQLVIALQPWLPTPAQPAP
jgi:hypothetical protein